MIHHFENFNIDKIKKAKENNNSKNNPFSIKEKNNDFPLDDMVDNNQINLNFPKEEENQLIISKSKKLIQQNNDNEKDSLLNNKIKNNKNNKYYTNEEHGGTINPDKNQDILNNNNNINDNNNIDNKNDGGFPMSKSQINNLENFPQENVVTERLANFNYDPQNNSISINNI